jgi:hypothetical protein
MMKAIMNNLCCPLYVGVLGGLTEEARLLLRFEVLNCMENRGMDLVPSVLIPSEERVSGIR